MLVSWWSCVSSKGDEEEKACEGARGGVMEIFVKRRDFRRAGSGGSGGRRERRASWGLEEKGIDVVVDFL